MCETQNVCGEVGCRDLLHGKVLQFTVRAEGATEAAGGMFLRQPAGAWFRPQAAAKDTTDWERRRCEGLLKRMTDQATAFLASGERG